MRCEVKRDGRGVWYARPFLGRTPEGKPIQPYRSFPMATSREEAQEMADAWTANLTPSGEYKSKLLPDLLDSYIEHREIFRASPNSVRQYRTFAAYVRKFIGNKLASELVNQDFIYFEQRLMVPKERGGQGLSPNSVRNVHDFLRSAYKHFNVIGVCEINPLTLFDKPRLQKYDATVLDVGDFAVLDATLRGLLVPIGDTVQDYRNALNAFAALLALRTGMRRGEVCAVRNCDVNRTAGCIAVSGNVIEEKGKRPYRRNVTKGRKCRNIAITDDDLRLIDTFLATRGRFCGSFAPSKPLVTVTGEFVRPSGVARAFKRISGECGMPGTLTFHGLRHTHATWLLTNGVDLKTVSERLGHADEATTLRIYGHVLPGRDAEAARVFAQAAINASGRLQ